MEPLLPLPLVDWSVDDVPEDVPEVELPVPELVPEPVPEVDESVPELPDPMVPLLELPAAPELP